MTELDPYQPPASFDSVEQKPEGPTVLKDPRLIGNAALTAISLQVFVKFLMAFGPNGQEWLIVLTVAHVFAFVSGICLYFIWIYRCASNVQRLNRHTEVKPGWVVGCYFIPLLNWVAPVISMRAIIRGSFVRGNPGALPSITVVWWLAYWVSNVVLRISHDPVMFGVWSVALVIAWISVTILVTRISRCQADFRWSDGPHSERVMMTPLPPRGAPSVAPLQVRRIHETGSGSAAVQDIESEWGRR